MILKLLVRLGFLCMRLARVPAIRCVGGETLYVVAYVVEFPEEELVVPALLIGAARTFCDARGLAMPSAGDIVPADAPTVH